MSDTSKLQNSLFEAMKIFSESAVKNSDATITIEGKIKEVVDAGLGEYTVEYKGNVLEVHSSNNATYSVGDNVYVVIPDGDYDKEKIILGTTEASAEAYIQDADVIANYSEVSDNLIDKDFGTIKMSSYETTRVENKDITAYTKGNFGKLIKSYLNDYRTFAFGFSAQTSMVIDQQVRGNYGVSLRIPLLAASEAGGGSTTSIWKTVTLDVGNMLGNPYRLAAWAPQTVYFTIDEQYQYDDSRVPQISYFCYDFTQDESKKNIKDIWIKDISFKVVNELSEDDTTGYSLSLKASQGEYFSTFYKTSKIITPTLKINGKTTSLKKAEIYWFRENAEVKADNDKYLPCGGFGWECLNARTNIAANPDGSVTFDYITNAVTLDVTQNQVKASARYKCVVIYKNKSVSSIITLKNLTSTQILRVESTSGTNVFVKDTGYVNLSAIVYYDGVTNTDNARDLVKISWLRNDKNGNFINDDDSFFEILSQNKREIITLEGSKVSCYITEIRFPVNQVEDYNTIYCSAKYVRNDNGNIVEELIGTEEMAIITSTDFTYNLVINGDDIIYKYDTDGDSPAGIAYDGPSTSKVESIKGLTYTLRKADGSELTAEEYLYVKYRWAITKNGMFTVVGATSSDDKFYYFTGYGNKVTIPYGIASRFNASKAASSIIELTVEFQGNTLRRNASISFIKEGMNGSNGTAYAARLLAGGLSAGTSVPYGTLDANGVANKLKFVYNISNKTLYRHDVEKNTLVPWQNNTRRIYAQVWENSQIVNTSNYTVEFSMFDAGMTNPCFYIADVQSNGARLELNRIPQIDQVYCNIVQAKIIVKNQSSIANQNEIIYVYYPIELTVTNFNTPVIPSMDGGFAEVMYASDGTNPSWDETSDFIVNDEGMIGGSLGQYFTISWSSSNHLNRTPNGAICKVKPSNKYDDGNSKNYVQARLAFNQNKKAELENQILALRNQNGYYEASIQECEQNKVYLNNFVSSYKGAEWNLKLNQIQTLLDRQTIAADKITSLLQNSLTKLEEYIYLQTNYNNKPVRRYCGELISEIKHLRDISVSALSQIRKLDGTSGRSFNELISLANYILSWNDEIKYRYSEVLGLDATLSLQLMIEDVNRQIEEYQDAYQKLMSLKGNGYENIYNQICTDIRRMCSQIPNQAFARYVGLRDYCLAYTDKFSQVTSIKDIKKIISDMYNNVLRGTFVLKNGQLSLSAAAIKEFNTQIEGYRDLISANNKTITDCQNILSTSGMSIVHIRPIVLYFNRYEMSNINAWDGNKIETGDGSYLLAPQVGAGVKEADNSFTGMIMGMKNLTGNTSSQYLKKGLFGYYKGAQTICLDAEKGTAVFGKSGNGGQIIIDPSSSDAMLYSSNFFKNYDKYTGLPTHYGTGNYNKQGMMINLSKPEIRFGNGNFVVDSAGNTTIAGSDNKIGGWKVTDTLIHSNVAAANGRITLDSGATVTGVDVEGNKVYSYSAGKVYSHNHNTLGSTAKGFYLGSDGVSIDKTFRVTNDGTLTVGNLSSGRHWTITGNGTQSYIGYNTDHLDNDNNGVGTSVYIGTDGISLGHNKFRVNDQGDLYSKSGTIGGWTINNTTLTAGHITLNSNGSMSGGSGDGTWSITTAGKATFNNLYADKGGSIAGWTISSNALTSTASNGNSLTIGSGGNIQAIDGDGTVQWSINRNGNARFNKLTANGTGSIAGWTISSNALTAQGISISSEGSISKSGSWSIKSDGSAHFKNITCDTTWSFGSGKNKWTNTGFTFGNGTLGGNTVSAAALAFTKGTMGLGTASKGNNGISYNGTKCVIAGDIYANNGYFKGDIVAKTLTLSGNVNAAGFKFYTDNSHYMEFNTGGNKHPTVTGLNVGAGGIAMGGHGISSCDGIDGLANLTAKASVLNVGFNSSGDHYLNVRGGVYINGDLKISNGTKMKNGHSATVTVGDKNLVFVHGVYTGYTTNSPS